MDHLHNINIERAILSTIFFHPTSFDEIAEVLKSSDFYLPSHRNIFESMLICQKENLPIDDSFIKNKLSKAKKFDEDTMLEIFATNPVPNFMPYVDELKEKAQKRALNQLSFDIKSSIDKGLDSPDILEETQKGLYTISSINQRKDFLDGERIATNTFSHIQTMEKKAVEGVVGVDTGFDDLNHLTTGFNKGELIIVAARPSMGKTSFVLSIADSVLKKNEGVAIFSLETPHEQLMLRMLSAKLSIPLQRLKIGDLRADEWVRLKDAIDYYKHSPIFIDDSSDVSLHKVSTQLRKLKSSTPSLSVAIIDYLQLMTSVSGKDRHLEIAEISRGLKILSRELDLPIIALSQLNRALESRTDKRPMLSDLRESGAIEQDADIILFVYRDDVYRLKEEKEKEKASKIQGKNYVSTAVEKPIENAEIIIGKNRNGPTGVVYLSFNKALTSFTNRVKDVALVEVIYNNSAEQKSKNFGLFSGEETGMPEKFDMPAL